MKTAWFSPHRGQVVHEIIPKNHGTLAAGFPGWSYCGGYFHGDQIHRAAKIVTCLWCVAKKER